MQLPPGAGTLIVIVIILAVLAVICLIGVAYSVGEAIGYHEGKVDEGRRVLKELRETREERESWIRDYNERNKR